MGKSPNICVTILTGCSAVHVEFQEAAVDLELQNTTPLDRHVTFLPLRRQSQPLQVPTYFRLTHSSDQYSILWNSVLDRTMALLSAESLTETPAIAVM